jgi:hypothetical protein
LYTHDQNNDKKDAQKCVVVENWHKNKGRVGRSEFMKFGNGLKSVCFIKGFKKTMFRLFILVIKILYPKNIIFSLNNEHVSSDQQR